MARLGKLTAVALIITFLSPASPATAVPELRGWVRDDHAGVPVVGAAIRLSLRSMGVAQETETDQSGYFALAEIPSGSYLLTVEKPNFMATLIPVEVVEGSVTWTTTNVRLLRHGVIEGRIDGAIAGEVVVTERVPGGFASRVFRSSVSQDGDFRIFGLPLGRYAVGMLNIRTANRYTRGLSVVWQDLIITGGEQHRLDLAAPIEKTTVVRGRLSPGGESDGAVGLVVVPAEQPSLRVWSQLVSPGGAFIVDGLLPGRYVVHAAQPPKGSEPARFGRATVSANGESVDQVVLELRRGASLSLLAKNIGGPRRSCPSTSVRLLPLEAWLPSATRTAVIAPATAVTLTDLAPTQYQLLTQSSSSDCIGVASGVDLTTANAIATIVFGPHPSLRVKLAADADQATGYWVVVADMTPGRDGYLRAAPSKAGKEVFFDLIAPGFYQASVLHDRSDRPVGPSILEGTPVTLSPGDAKSIELRTSR